MKSSLWSIAKNSHSLVANLTEDSSPVLVASAFPDGPPPRPLLFLSGEELLAADAGASSWK